MKNKYFIITIDTEEDNQWDNTKSSSTNNAKYLPRFQELAEKYNYKPVWLITYGMASDDFFVNYFKEKQNKGLCEIGMHLHAWNNPPYYKLNTTTNNRSYIIEYPKDIIDEKVNVLTKLITEKFNQKPISHRSGRWSLSEDYLNILEKKGYRIDCSVTPGINWSKNLGSTGLKGNDYSKYPKSGYYIANNIYELPVTIKKIHVFDFKRICGFRSLVHELKHFILGSYEWVRPNKYSNLKEMKKILKKSNRKNEYIMFMIHSSELMPGGSPNFIDEKAINNMYGDVEYIFKLAKKMGYLGITLKELYKEVRKDE